MILSIVPVTTHVPTDPSLPTPSPHLILERPPPVPAGSVDDTSPPHPAAVEGPLGRDLATEDRALGLAAGAPVLQAELLAGGAEGLDAQGPGERDVALLGVARGVVLRRRAVVVVHLLEDRGAPLVAGDVGDVVLGLVFGTCRGIWAMSAFL